MTDANKVTLLNGRYELGELLGLGGMGKVYRARDTLLDREVAVKFVSEGDLGTEARARMLQEAKAIARLNHPNIVQIHDAGEPKVHETVGRSHSERSLVIAECLRKASELEIDITPPDEGGCHWRDRDREVVILQGKLILAKRNVLAATVD